MCTSRIITFALLLFCFSFYSNATEQNNRTRPNIIFFLVDDMGWQETSLPFYKEITDLNKRYHTPNMESLAEKGVMFTQAYACAVCSPTRVSLMTGMNAARHKVTNWTLRKNKSPDREYETIQAGNWNMNGIAAIPGIEKTTHVNTLPMILKEAGYRTIHAGKAHFGARGTPGENPLNLGFDVNIAGHAAGGPGSYHGEKNFSAVWRVGNTESATIWDVPGLEKYHGEDINLTEALTLEANKEVEKAVRENKPFYLYMSHYAIHAPWEKDKRFYQKYIDAGLSEFNAVYASMVESMDKSLGDIILNIERLGIEENTIIVFMSDNGSPKQATRNVPLRGHKITPYEGGIRVPMIVSWPGVSEPGSKCNDYIIIEDVFPTFLEMAGIDTYEQIGGKIDGISFVPLLKGKKPAIPERPIYWHFPNTYDVQPYSTVRKGDWKLIYTHTDRSLELYNIKEDISEENDLFDQHKNKAKELSVVLSDFLRETDAPMSINKATNRLVEYPDAFTGGQEDRDWTAYPMADGPFEGTWASLDQYEAPEWYRDAKLGYWSIIGPQCIPMQGGWYARDMYVQGKSDYNYHVENYGHPSEFGYKDLIELFNPTELDYDKLLGLYKEAGAKYAIILAAHHDNYDLWNSAHHEWNSVNKGPKRDLVGEFRHAALKHDLRFGVTTHFARSINWFQTNKGADETGPLKGVPYDGNDPEYASLYHPKFVQPIDTGYYPVGYPVHPPEAWSQQWYLRAKDLIDRYEPDFMYFDGGIPFEWDGAVGRRLMAHYYNANMKRHGGELQAVLSNKNVPAHGVFREGVALQSFERTVSGKIRETAWQSETCIGQWYYNSEIRYKSAKQVIHMLIDIVSKNGDLLLNIPLHPNGSIDAREEAFLKEMAAWMKVNGPAIYGTRPWEIFGEGPANKEGGHHRETEKDYTSGDFRFTSKGDTIFAFCMDWPDSHSVSIKSIKPEDGSEIHILGYPASLKWEFDPGSDLAIHLPRKLQKERNRPCEHAFAFIISGERIN